MARREIAYARRPEAHLAIPRQIMFAERLHAASFMALGGARTRVSLAVLRELGYLALDSAEGVTVSLVGDEIVAVERGDTTGRVFASPSTSARPPSSRAP